MWARKVQKEKRNKREEKRREEKRRKEKKRKGKKKKMKKKCSNLYLGFFIEPTVFADVKDEMSIAKEVSKTREDTTG